ncbi:hypothetical protein SDC9_48677 [bioreactor metagenome]|uniref:Uncharacterized protein n=1 Tax=bioreactor metagenome TaxID=1076179 RepID=A0A644WFZ6_9ZZZZ
MLKWLIRIWIGQNFFMLLSVIVRNVRYIHYYNLASLRIGVFIFLSIAAFALIVLMIKINKGRNMFWLYKKVFIFSAIILTLTSALNWNRIIARYNISHRESAYFHYDYMVMLPQTIDIMMENRDVFCIPYSSSRYHIYTEKDFSKTNPEKYSEVIDRRIESIQQELQEKDWREWNYPDFRILKYLEDN